MKIKAKLQEYVLPPTFFVICAILAVVLGIIQYINVIIFPYDLFGVLFLFMGLYISRMSSNKFEKVKTNINTFDEPDKLVTDGPFRYSRNPMYLGFATALFGISIILGTLLAFIPFILFIVVTDQWYIKFEEKMMIKKFGEKYLNYIRTTRKWI